MTLESRGGAPLGAIAHDLGTLKTLVSAHEPDWAKLGKSLEGLATKVGKVGEEQGGVIGAALKSLSGTRSTSTPAWEAAVRPAKCTARTPPDRCRS